MLLNFLRVKGLFVCLEKLIGVSASWDDHGGVGGPTEHTFVESDILGSVLGLGTTVGVLIFVFRVDDTGRSTVEARALLLIHD